MKRISDLLAATRQKAKHAQEVGKDMAAMEYTSYADAIEELQAKLDAVRGCETYMCDFPDTNKVGPAYRQRDIWVAIGDKEQNDV